MQGTNQQYDKAGIDLEPCFNKMDAVWEHPETKAKLFVGGESAAKDLELLRSNNISHIVNCRGSEVKNTLENTEGLCFFRMCIISSKPVKTAEDIWEFFKDFFGFVDGALNEGKSVLIHCLAGAHRAPTATAAYLLYKMQSTPDEIRAHLKSCRPIVDLRYFGCDSLLQVLHKELPTLRKNGTIS